MRFSAHKGFTLVELVIVVGIISVLLIALISYIDPIAQFNKAKDTRRVADLDEIKKALALYYNDTGCYPVTPPPFGRRWVNSDNENTIYMEMVPQDPQGGTYSYIHQKTTGTNPCPQWYVLYAHLAKQATPDNKCSIDPNDTNIANCAPSDYAASSDFYSCKTSGNVTCD